MSDTAVEPENQVTPDKTAEKESPKKEDASASDDFSLDNLKSHFEKCLGPSKEVYLDKYLLGYEELYKFLNLLGTVFGWVATDVFNKMEIVRGHRKDSEKGSNYVTVQSMLSHEIETDMIKPKLKDSTTGTRNLLRLHRALEYINAFLEGIPGLETNDKCCPMSQEAYKKTLIKYHPWVVQKAAMMAMHMLPTKEGLIKKIGDIQDEETLTKATETLNGAVNAMKKVHEVTQELYSEKDLLNLP